MHAIAMATVALDNGNDAGNTCVICELPRVNAFKLCQKHKRIDDAMRRRIKLLDTRTWGLEERERLHLLRSFETRATLFDKFEAALQQESHGQLGQSDVLVDFIRNL